ncbi:hypothetical protein [Fibrella forsythiae]|uniref:CopG family transcriptional regulator n=1 Tax=Fibrella forsythiae TaxID=2817061 RepID=A0ABS3JT16_9BACT|nr:hypothetical protein [Fibrella forsythiae]MBO0953140.1 hypothetical protein [Fibrella forsythiae]
MKSKKDFTGGLSSLLGETPQLEAKPAILPKTVKEITKTSQIGTKEEETRATFIVNEGMLEKIKAIAYWERLQIKDVISTAFSEYLASYEKKNGPIQSIPKK